MSTDRLDGAARALEDAFFSEENARLLGELRAKSERQARREALRSALRLDDDEVADHLLDLGLCPETALAVTLVPLAMVAWADGEIQPGERDAILRAAADEGVKPDSLAAKVLDHWLTERPGPKLVEAWSRYIRAIWSSLTDQERRELREAGLGRARQIAQAAGGFLGLGSKISQSEQKVLDEIDAALR